MTVDEAIEVLNICKLLASGDLESKKLQQIANLLQHQQQQIEELQKCLVHDFNDAIQEYQQQIEQLKCCGTCSRWWKYGTDNSPRYCNISKLSTNRTDKCAEWEGLK